ncbi:hypothetical protein Tco_0786897 [Tanacetum coccineum]
MDARAINLDNELRSIKIGKMTISEYCTKIKSMADRLKNLGCVVMAASVPVAPKVGAATVASPAGVLELDTHSSLEADLSKSSTPPVSVFRRFRVRY